MSKQGLKLAKREEMTVRAGTLADLDGVKAIYQDFTGEHMECIARLDKDRVSLSVEEMLSRDQILLAELDGRIIGAIAAYFVPSHFTADTLFNVMFFYVQKEFRRFSSAFIQALESLLIRDGRATKIIFSAPAFDRSELLERFYEKQGYTLLESHYAKDLKAA